MICSMIHSVRYLLEAASGIFTGSIYNNAGIKAAGHYGEGRDFRDGSTILQKTHRNIPRSGRFEGRGVLVIRNPYKALISFYNYGQTRSQTKSVAAQNLATKRFHKGRVQYNFLGKSQD